MHFLLLTSILVAYKYIYYNNSNYVCIYIYIYICLKIKYLRKREFFRQNEEQHRKYRNCCSTYIIDS